MWKASSTGSRGLPTFDLPVLLILVAAPVAIAVAVTTGAIQDYRVHLRLWKLVLLGADPYVRSVHAYGPAFNALAPLVRVHPLAPKLAFVGVWLGIALWLLVQARRVRPEATRLPLWIALFLLNPWFWSEVGVYGHFDVMVGAACLFTVHAVHTGRFNRGAALLSLGILFKFLPALMLPSLAFDSRRSMLRVRPLLICVAFCGLGFAATYALYGASMFEPFRFGELRPSSGFSIFEYLRGQHSFLLVFGAAPNLDAWSTPMLLLAAAGTTGVVLARRIDAATSALLLMLVVLALYRAGHSQFQMIPALLAPYWIVVHGTQLAGRWTLCALGIYFGWLFLETLAWVTGPWPLFASLDGLVHFAVAANLYLALLCHAIRRSEGGSLGLRTLRLGF